MDEKLQEILNYYGANLDNSGEPDEIPEFEGAVMFPSLEEEISRTKEWARKVQSWNKDGGENL
ncbi:MAG: hypothetical protein IJ859_00905 [Synergistaceae bacterium]|nr:hypothetical protein [Synergistaceae bacterium]